MVQYGDPAPSADQDGVVRDDRAQICLSMIANVVAVVDVLVRGGCFLRGPKVKNSHGGKIDDIFFGKRSPPPQTETGSFVMTAHGSALTVLPMSIRNQRRKIFGRRPMSKSNRKDSICDSREFDAGEDGKSSEAWS